MKFTRRTTLLSLASASVLLPSAAYANTAKRARIFVSLADNKNQGIVPIKASLGNGQDPKSNLYWGALYGMNTYFKRHKDYTVKTVPSSREEVLDAVEITAHNMPDIKITAEAWNGAYQTRTVKAFFAALRAARGRQDLIGFVGHNAMMDRFYPRFLGLGRSDTDKYRPQAAVIACDSETYFKSGVELAGADPYVMTRGLMAPEAYVMEGILQAWLAGEPASVAKRRAAEQYAKYQKIPLRNAKRLFGAPL